jgi:hypothetical protein
VRHLAEHEEHRARRDVRPHAEYETAHLPLRAKLEQMFLGDFPQPHPQVGNVLA